MKLILHVVKCVQKFSYIFAYHETTGLIDNDIDFNFLL